MLTEPVRFPGAVGVKVTLIVQLAPTASRAARVGLRKVAIRRDAEIISGGAPVLVSVSF